MPKHATTSGRRSRPRGLVLGLAGIAASVVLAGSVSGTFSAYTAAISNTKNSANTVSIGMTQGSSASSTTCASTPTGTTECGTDMYVGKDLRPGDVAPATKTVFTNTGSVAPSSFTLVPSTCTGGTSAPSSICNWLLVTVTWTTTVNGSPASSAVVDRTSASAIAGKTYTVPNPPGAAGSGTMTVQVELASNAPNDSQNQSLGQTLVWTFTA